MESKIKDINLAEFGRKEISLAEAEMPGLMSIRKEYSESKTLEGKKIVGSLHMTVQTAVLIETLKSLGADLRWCSCNIFSTQDHAAAAIVDSGAAVVFAWKGETIREYWDCTYNALMWPDNTGPDLIVDDGSDITMLIHKGVEFENKFEKDGQLPSNNDASSTEEEEMYRVIRESIVKNKNNFRNIADKIIGVSEETTTGVHRLVQLEKQNKLLFPAINVNDCVTKSKFDNVYGCRHSTVDGIMRATDTMIAGKRAMVCGYGDVGKGGVQSLKAAGAIVTVAEIDPICALQAYMEGIEVKRIEDVVQDTDIFITATGNCNVITLDNMKQMKNNAIIGNIGHFDNEIEMDELEKCEDVKCTEIKPQVDLYTFKSTSKSVIVLAKGRLMNLGCATGHPSFVMSCSFSNQVLAQIELVQSHSSFKTEKHITVSVLPKHLDEKVASLHLEKLGCNLTVLTEKQSKYVNIPTSGPYKQDHYRY